MTLPPEADSDRVYVFCRSECKAAFLPSADPDDVAVPDDVAEPTQSDCSDGSCGC